MLAEEASYGARVARLDGGIGGSEDGGRSVPRGE